MHSRKLLATLLLGISSIVLLTVLATAVFTDVQKAEPYPLQVPLGDRINVIVTVDLAPSYSLFRYVNTNIVNVTVIPEITNALSPFNVTVDVPMSQPRVVKASQNVTYSLGLPGSPFSHVFTISFPPTASSRLVILGYSTGTSVLWRDSFDLPPVSVTSVTSGYNVAYSLALLLPNESVLLKVFSSPSSLPGFSTGEIQARQAIVIPTLPRNSDVIVLYQPQIWNTASFLILILVIILFVAETRLRHAIPLGRLPAYGSKVMNILKTVDPKKLLTIFVLIGLLMVSLSFLAGPAPQLRVYSLASPGTSNMIASQVKDLGGFTLTPEDEISQLDILANTGAFTVLVVADYVLPDQQFISNHLNAAFSSAPHIILVDKVDNVAINAALKEAVRGNSRGLLLDVPDLPGLYSALANLYPRPNPLRLPVSLNVFDIVMKFVGAASLVLAFFALSYLGLRLTQADVGNSSGLGEALANVLMVFALAEGFYLVASVLLGVPVGLHATLTQRVTAIGFLGFGGGSRPRFIIGLLGFLFGGLAGMMRTRKVNKVGIFAFVVLLFFVLTDPLTGGVIFYQIINSFTVGPTSEVSGQVGGAVRDILGWAVAAFSSPSPTYDTSHGVALYFALSSPLFVIRKLRPSTATVLFLVSALGAADGFIRIAEMRPIKILSDLLPGFAVGLGVALVALTVSWVEGLIRERV